MSLGPETLLFYDFCKKFHNIFFCQKTKTEPRLGWVWGCQTQPEKYPRINFTQEPLQTCNKHTLNKNDVLEKYWKRIVKRISESIDWKGETAWRCS